jgi:hypothetical protein
VGVRRATLKNEIASHAFFQNIPALRCGLGGAFCKKTQSGITKIAGIHTPPYAEAQAGYAAYNMFCFNLALAEGLSRFAGERPVLSRKSL